MFKDINRIEDFTPYIGISIVSKYFLGMDRRNDIHLL